MAIRQRLWQTPTPQITLLPRQQKALFSLRYKPLSKGRPPHQQRCRRIRCQNLDSTTYETSWHARGPEMAHRPCLLSVHAPSATAGMALPLRPPSPHFGMHPAGRAIASKFGRHNSPRRAPTRGGGHPQGAPLPIVFSRRFALGRAPTRGAPTDCPLSAFCPGKGAHKGRPYPIQAASRGFSNLMAIALTQRGREMDCRHQVG